MNSATTIFFVIGTPGATSLRLRRSNCKCHRTNKGGLPLYIPHGRTRGSAPCRSPNSPCSTHRHAYAVHGVVAHAVRVPLRLERLGRTGRVGRAAREPVLAGGRLPVPAPALPREAAPLRLDIRVAPGAVHRDLDARN